MVQKGISLYLRRCKKSGGETVRFQMGFGCVIAVTLIWK